MPIDALRLVVGGLLLVFGLQWLRKAILRASGYKALHDEDAIFARELREAETAAHEERAGLDWYGFTLSFKGVFLEGLEVAFIVLDVREHPAAHPARGSGRRGVAVVLVAVVGVLVHVHRSPRAGELDEVRRRRDADDLRDLLGGRRRRRLDWPGGDAVILGVLAFVARARVRVGRRAAPARREPVGGRLTA